MTFEASCEHRQLKYQKSKKEWPPDGINKGSLGDKGRSHLTRTKMSQYRNVCAIYYDARCIRIGIRNILR